MKKQILIEGRTTPSRLNENNQVQTLSWGKPIVCGDCCKKEGINPNKNNSEMKIVEDLNAFFYYDADKKTIVCGNCGRELGVTKTPEEFETERIVREKAREEKARKMNEEKLQNLHLTLAGEDWECGFKYYCLSANIDYNDWLKVKEHFRYYKRGWSRNQELEWYGFEPTGWLTKNPEEVERILVDAGLIKPENTMKAITERKELEKQRKAEEQKKAKAEREEIKAKMDEINSKIQDAFDNSEKRELSDAEANEHYFNADFGKGNVRTYRIINKEIIMCENMGDFKYGIAIPFSQYVKQMIENFYYFNKQLWSYSK